MFNVRAHLVALALAASLGTLSCKDEAAPADDTSKSDKGSDDPMDDPEVAKAAAKYDCGAKGQDPCPMQKWMKNVMLNASKSGDGEKLSAALGEAAKKPVKGFDEWATIATEGATAAADGDIEAAKKSCKKCHELYKKEYIKTMRDQPW